MPNYAADDMSAIAKRRAEIRREEGRWDDNWRTALGADLDARAASYELTRLPGESDHALRERVRATHEHKNRKL